MADAGEFDYWLAGELPPMPPEHVDSGEMDYWQAGELPYVMSQAAAPVGVVITARHPAAYFDGPTIF